MEARAGMLAGPFERSMGLGAEWRVTDVWSGERGDAPDELHIRVAHAEGRAVGCPECGRRHGTHDTRERTWRHPGIWRHGTIVHCAVFHKTKVSDFTNFFFRVPRLSPNHVAA